MFQSAFKYYKSKKPPPSFNDVLIVGDSNYPFKVVEPHPLSRPGVFPSLRLAEEWKIYEVTTHPGLIVIPNPFTPTGQRYWMAASLIDYPAQPNTTNLATKQIESYPRSNGWWETLQTIIDPVARRKFANMLRWSTLGYQYDWSNKIYTETRKEVFPADLAGLLRFIATVLGYERFSPEAAIVNYYPIGSTLAGHTDHSEDDLTAPLFSLSFGQPAVFLIGGTSRDEPADAILLRSGDVLVMTGASRQCYHAVPRVCAAKELPEGLEKCSDRWQPSNQSGDLDCISLQMANRSDADWRLIDDYVQHSRININVRQVLKENQLHLTRPDDSSLFTFCRPQREENDDDDDDDEMIRLLGEDYQRDLNYTALVNTSGRFAGTGKRDGKTNPEMSNPAAPVGRDRRDGQAGDNSLATT